MAALVTLSLGYLLSTRSSRIPPQFSKSSSAHVVPADRSGFGNLSSQPTAQISRGAEHRIASPRRNATKKTINDNSMILVLLHWRRSFLLLLVTLFVLLLSSRSSHAREAPRLLPSSSNLLQSHHQSRMDLLEVALPPAQSPDSNRPAEDCDQGSIGAECSPPSDSSFTSNKRLVPTGPNPLHNR
uniref:CLAVATA3/endosperm surrounding region 1 n=1 Tax=Selaginella moellendorffii TaxID=88036 RepID=C0STM9_SELML|nr:CLAVATA3/endosperm surrounding region 1 [Selaginella moellendorffii]